MSFCHKLKIVIPTSVQPDVVDLWYFKLWILWILSQPIRPILFYLINAQTTQTHEALFWKTIYRKKFKVKITNKSFFKNTKEIWFCTKKSDPAHKIKDLSCCHKLWFSNTFIVATRCRRSLIFQTMISLDHII